MQFVVLVATIHNYYKCTTCVFTVSVHTPQSSLDYFHSHRCEEIHLIVISSMTRTDDGDNLSKVNFEIQLAKLM